MGINISWFNEDQTALQISIVGDWTWDEYWAIRSQYLHPLLDTAGSDVTLIYDLTQTVHLPSHALSAILQMIETCHPRVAPDVFVVGAPFHMRTLLAVVGRTLMSRHAHPLHLVDHVDEVLRQLRTTPAAAITVDWLDDRQTCVLWQFHRRWTADEYFEAVECSNRLIASKWSPVDVIADLGDYVPTTHNVLVLARRGFGYRPANLGRVIIVSQSAFWQRVYRMIGQHPFIGGHSIQLAFDLNEAQAALIAAID